MSVPAGAEGLVPLDLAPENEVCFPCPHCDWHWRFQIMIEEDTGYAYLREWHKPGCKMLDDLADDE